MARVTISDVARKSGYGLGTVSRALRGDASIKQSTREEILKVVEELNYTPNINGARLRQKHSNVIAVLVPIINHPVFAELVESVEQIAFKHNYSVLLVSSQLNVDKENEILTMIKQKEVDGAIFVTHYEHDEEILHDCPLVSIDRHLNHSIPYVSSDNYDATKAVIEKFVQNGDKNIGFIGTKPHVDSEVMLREKAYIDVMNEHGLDIKLVNEVINHGEEKQLVDSFFEKYPNLDAIFASGNTLTQIVHHKLKELGKDVPNEIELVGYDGVFSQWNSSSEISAIQQPIQEMAEAAFEILIKVINDEPVEQRNIYKTKFIKGTTTR